MPFELREYTDFATVAGLDNVHFRYDNRGEPVPAERLHVTVVYKGPPKCTVHHYYHSTKHTWRVKPREKASLILGAERLATLRTDAIEWGNKDGRQADAVAVQTTVQAVPKFNLSEFPELPKKKNP